jgi:CubicO group peptidase (beta-lactamase class C family)
MNLAITKTAAFPRCAPHEAGLDETRLTALLEAIRAAGVDLHSILLLHRGQLVLENCAWPYGPDRRQVMHSIAKSFTSAAIGLALEEGRLTLDAKVVSFFPEYLPPVVDGKLAAMTVEDLLTMKSGHGAEISGSVWRRIKTSWIAEFFKVPVVHQPGTTYVYSSACSYMLSAILTRVTGQTLHDYLKPRLFAPLGIEGERWDIGSDGINPGGNGLTCKPMDLLKFGALYAQKGEWQGKRILPADWVERSVRPYSDNSGRDTGYGYHWFTAANGEFSGTGLFGQVVVVYPALDMVAVVTSATPGASPCTGQILPLLRNYLAAAVQKPAADPALSPLLAQAARIQPLVSLDHPAPAHLGTHRYRVLENDLGITALGLAVSNDTCVLELTDGEGVHSIAMGVGRWVESETGIPGQDLHHGYRLQAAKVVAGARWLDPDTLEMHWYFAESVFIDTVMCRFGEGQVSYARSVNVNSGRTSQPALVGTLI